MDRSLLCRLVLDFQAHDNRLADKWITMDTWAVVFSRYYGLGPTTKVNTQTITKAILSLGPVTMSAHSGNKTNIYLHQDTIRLCTKRITFMCISSTSMYPTKPAKSREWKHLLPLSISVANNNTQEQSSLRSSVPSFKCWNQTIHFVVPSKKSSRLCKWVDRPWISWNWTLDSTMYCDSPSHS